MKQNIPFSRHPLAFNWYAFLIAIIDLDMPPCADNAFRAMEKGLGFRQTFTMPLNDIIDLIYLREHDGWTLDELAGVTGKSRYIVHRNIKKHRELQPIKDDNTDALEKKQA